MFCLLGGELYWDGSADAFEGPVLEWGWGGELVDVNVMALVGGQQP